MQSGFWCRGCAMWTKPGELSAPCKQVIVLGSSEDLEGIQSGRNKIHEFDESRELEPALNEANGADADVRCDGRRVLDEVQPSARLRRMEAEVASLKKEVAKLRDGRCGEVMEIPEIVDPKTREQKISKQSVPSNRG
eukprot:gnl/MRDRNA2_/MRDRNA2_161748_c0_seq1.p1 gnl/MRDRNA2_/MRDRNA2_161748_c0~~gnl/MRDRNA2_/MRDRNA2_161748_c0_seq1.p1  ORF type:complete len:137 (-),score=28.09 gnl/MRDRNA2_/MRDRNA2_161748_c0_seq1:21-431(-)